VVIEVFESVNMRQRSHQSSATNLKVGHVRSFIVLWCVRCHLPSGKTVWLCAEHQKQDGATILSDEVADVNAVSQDVGIDMATAFQDLTPNADGSHSTRPTNSANKSGTRTKQTGP